jgi:molybdenum ABC transporter molybdate-binding protein
MTTDDLSWMGDWAVGVRVWVERHGEAVLGQGRLELLEEIDRCHSISAAARQAGISYRHAWVTVQEINRAAGEAMVEAATGGRNGGGARLTPHGQQAVAAFHALQERMRLSASLLRPRAAPDPAAACVRVAAAVSLEEVLGQLLTDFGLQQPLVRVRAVFGASDELCDQILEGAPADLFLAADPEQLARLETLGWACPGASTPLAENALAVIGPADADIPVTKAADLLGPGLYRVALAVRSSPLGGYTWNYLERRGLYEAIAAKAVVVENAQAVAAAVRGGQADVGIAYASSVRAASDCRVLFRVGRIAVAIRYTGVLLRQARQPEQGRRLLEFLASPMAARRFRRCGFLPVRK